MSERAAIPAGDYVLGTQDEEIERLGLQHRLWRHRMLDCWRRARIRRGGPGFSDTGISNGMDAPARHGITCAKVEV